MAFSALTIDLTARLARFESEMNKATASINKFGQTGDRIANGFKATFATLGASVAAGAFVAFAKNTVDAADALNDMSKRTGVTVKDLASLRTISEQSGTSLDGLAKGLQKLGLSIGQAQNGSKEVAESLKRLGVTAKDPKEALFQLADAVKASIDPTRTAADLQKVLGKSYADLIPLLQEGGQGLREAAKASESFADAMARLAPDADKFNDNLAQLKTNATGLAAQFLSDLIPAVNEITKAMSAAYQESGFLKAAIVGLGGLGVAIFTDEFKSDLARLEKLKKQLADIESLPIPGLVASEAKRAALRAEIRQLEANVAAAQAAASKEKQPRPAGTIDLSAATKSTARTSAKSDPLASLLGSTEIGKVAEFEKLMGLLNARLDAGKISAEQYRQASEKLFSNTFAADIAAINKQLEYNAETERLIAEHLDATTNELNEQSQAWAEAGKAIEEQFGNAADRLANRLSYLQQLLDRGVISWEAYSNATLDAQAEFDRIGEKLSSTQSELDIFAQNAAKGIQDAFADFLFDPFAEGLDGMLQGFADMIQRMVAQAIAAQLARHLFGDLVSGGTGEGVLGGIFKSVLGGLVGSANGNVFMNAPALSAYSGSVVSKPTLFPFAQGIGLMGEAGAEAILPLKRGNDGKLGVAGGGGVTNNFSFSFSVSGPVDRRAEQRVAAAVYQSVVRASRRNS